MDGKPATFDDLIGMAQRQGRQPDDFRSKLDRLLVGTYTDPDNTRLAQRLCEQRGQLPRFLDHDTAEATNNLAQRQVRPAVIVRKLSARNRTEVGVATHAALASVVRTCPRQRRDIRQDLAGPLCQGLTHVVAAVAQARSS